MRDDEGKSGAPKSEAETMLARSYALLEEAAAEREEVLRHKWFQSEKAGHEVTFEDALADWLVNYRAEWKQKWREGRNAAK